MRVPPHHFAADLVYHILHRKKTFLRSNLRVHHNLQKDITQFLNHIFGIAGLIVNTDRGKQLRRLFHHAGF
jgi:hypothetical protein